MDVLALMRDIGGLAVAMAAIGVLRAELRELRRAVQELADGMRRE
jgi:HAMP domain-containing protein